jgi:hypothetical protein
MKQKSHWMGSYWERVTTLVCNIVETCSVIVKLYLICFENTAVFEMYSLILQEMFTMDNFISRKIKVVYHRNCYRKYTSKQNCSVFKTYQIKFYNYWTRHWHIMHCSQFNVSFLLFGLEGESFKGLPNDAIIRNMNVSVRLNSGCHKTAEKLMNITTQVNLTFRWTLD